MQELRFFEILVYFAVQEKLPLEIIVKLSEVNTLEDGLLLLERFNQSLADKLFKNLSNTIEKRSFAYVNKKKNKVGWKLW